MNHMLHHLHTWSLDGLTRSDVLALIRNAHALKRAAQPGGVPQLLRGKNIALLSDDHASPAATAFHRAAAELGAQVARIRTSDPHSTELRDPRDTAGLLGRLYDAIECEGMPAAQVQQMDRDAGVPVFNGIGNLDHPTRILADLMTLQDLGGGALDQLSLRFVGDPSSPAGDALAKAADLIGIDLEIPEPGRGEEAVSGCSEQGVLEISKVQIVCEAGEGGRLPLRLSAPHSMPTRSLAYEQAINQRCVLQALLVSTIA